MIKKKGEVVRIKGQAMDRKENATRIKGACLLFRGTNLKIKAATMRN